MTRVYSFYEIQAMDTCIHEKNNKDDGRTHRASLVPMRGDDDRWGAEKWTTTTIVREKQSVERNTVVRVQGKRAVQKSSVAL